MLVVRNGRSDSLTLEGRVVAPAQGIDECLRITVEDGVIARIEPAAATGDQGHRPGVRRPARPSAHPGSRGRGDDSLRAPQAAAAGGYCAILAMPNTDPVVDSASVLGALVDRAREEAVVPTGFMAAISKGQLGEELTEMAELAGTGAAAFTDDGRPVVSAGLMRRALQYSGLTRAPARAPLRGAVALARGPRARGSRLRRARARPVSVDARRASWSSATSRSRRPRARQIHLMHLSARESVAALDGALANGASATGEVTPHHLVLTDEAVRSLDPNVKMNPPLRSEDDREALRDALRRGAISCIATDHAPHARHEKDVPFEEAPFGVTGLETAFAALHTHLVVPGIVSARDAARADV